MTLRFPRFSQGLAQDPTTRRIWFGIATAHDFESHDDITEERLYQNIFASHFGKCCIFWYIIMDWISLSGSYPEFSHLLNFFGISPIQK